MQNIPNKTGGIKYMTIIETHTTDQSTEFIKLYNNGASPHEIRNKLGIGHSTYYSYRKQNQDKLHKTTQCQVCGITITIKNSQQKYCSKKCRLKAKYQRDKKRGKDVLQRNTKTNQ